MALRIAVVGVGFGTTVHVPAFLSEGLEVVAISARRRERAEEAARAFSIPRAVTDYDEVLAMDDVDAVSIVTPPALHKEMTLKAIAAGKHVIVEKPFALNAEEAAEMAAAAAASPVTAMVAHEFRWASGRMRVKELLEEGAIGDVRLVLARLLRGPVAAGAATVPEWVEGRDSAASGAGFLFALGSHYVDGLRHWLGEVVEVSGSVSNAEPERVRDGMPATADADDTFSFTLRFASGAVAQMVASRVAPFAAESSIALYGSTGSLVTPQVGFNPPAHGTVLGARLGVDSGLVELEVPERLAPFTDDRDDRLMPFRLFTRAFLQGVADGTSPAPNFEDGLANQLVLDAVRTSSATGQRISLAP